MSDEDALKAARALLRPFESEELRSARNQLMRLIDANSRMEPILAKAIADVEMLKAELAKSVAENEKLSRRFAYCKREADGREAHTAKCGQGVLRCGLHAEGNEQFLALVARAEEAEAELADLCAELSIAAQGWRNAASKVHQADSPSIFVDCADELEAILAPFTREA